MIKWLSKMYNVNSEMKIDEISNIVFPIKKWNCLGAKAKLGTTVFIYLKPNLKLYGMLTT